MEAGGVDGSQRGDSELHGTIRQARTAMTAARASRRCARWRAWEGGSWGRRVGPRDVSAMESGRRDGGGVGGDERGRVPGGECLLVAIVTSDR